MPMMAIETKRLEGAAKKPSTLDTTKNMERSPDSPAMLVFGYERDFRHTA
jgi:hypothetical protein